MSVPLKRLVNFEHGFDYRGDPDPKKSQYGCHGLNIRFLVIGEKGAVQFLIYSMWLPSMDLRHLKKPSSGPMAADLGYHSRTPHYEGQSKRNPCEYIPGGCYYDGS